jgi:CDP-glucose 4,6-dehydratase
MGGDDPYSNSKGCAELVSTAWRQSYFPVEAIDQHGVALASARAGNAIGGGDWTPNQLIPDLVRSFAADQSCLIRQPGAIRPWQFVLEPLRGYLVLAERLSGDGASFASGWNFGPVEADARPVEWIADRLASSWGGSASWRRDHAAHPPEAPVLRLDASKAAAHLGWRPTLPLGDALDWIVEWYRAWNHGDDVAALTRDQLARYEQRLAA